jgi:hypothetical protein
MARRPYQGIRRGTIFWSCHAAPDGAVALPSATRSGAGRGDEREIFVARLGFFVKVRGP